MRTGRREYRGAGSRDPPGLPSTEIQINRVNVGKEQQHICTELQGETFTCGILVNDHPNRRGPVLRRTAHDAMQFDQHRRIDLGVWR